MGIDGLLPNRKYKIGDKINFQEGFTSHEYEITSARGARSMNEHKPKTHEEFKSFTRRKR